MRDDDDLAGPAPSRSPHDPRQGSADRRREPLPDRLEGLPDLPTGYARALEAGIASLGLALGPETRAAIDGHVRLLVAWNQAINLTAIREPAEIARLHVVDSLTAAPWLLTMGGPAFLDLGSGGGFPGLPLAAVLRPDRALLVDATAKKAAFLRMAARLAGLADRVAVAAERSEALARQRDQRERWPIVTARAIADLAELAELAFPLLLPGGRLLAWKRGDLTAEHAALGRALPALGGGEIEAELAAPVDAGLPGHRIVVVRKRDRTPALFPREPGVRRRQPW